MSYNLIVVFLANSKVSFVAKVYKLLLRSVLTLVIAYKSYLCVFYVRLNIPSLAGLVTNVALFFKSSLKYLSVDR
jgi:hypothetical protein